MSDEMLVHGGRNKYLHIKNAGGKNWLIPSCCMKEALALYEPSSLKGKLLKRILPIFKNSKLLLQALNIKADFWDIHPDFAALTESVFRQKDLKYSFFFGTPGVHQKVTVQVFDKNRILGYCKLSPKPEITEAFYREKNCLEDLTNKQITNIPKCLFCGAYKEQGIFVQSTTKSFSSHTYHDLRAEHLDFAVNLHKKTQLKMTFEETEYAQRLREMCSDPPDGISRALSRDMLEEVISAVRNYLSKREDYSFYHGDFTPWNTYFTHNGLYVFDFEYAKRSYPPYLDLFHFFTQTELYQHKSTAEKIYNKFKKVFYTNEFAAVITDPEMYYIMYLLDIIGFYYKRDKGIRDEETTKNQKIRCEVMLMCYDFIKTENKI